MIQLFDGCYCSNPAISPANWKTTSASLKVDWYVQYRFYDPTTKDDKGRVKPKLCIVKGGVNLYKTLTERRDAIKTVLAEELKLLKDQGFNPITGQFMAPIQEEIEDDIEYQIHPSTPFINALDQALKQLDLVPNVRTDMDGIIRGVEKTAIRLRIDKKPIGSVTSRNVQLILDKSKGKDLKPLSNHRYNAYRSYLMMLFKELKRVYAIDTNPLRDIDKKKTIKRLRRVLDMDDRVKVDNHLKEVFPRFQKFVHLFFHSGGRKTEILQLKPDMVDLKRQVYRSIIRKGGLCQEVERTIKTIAIPYWEFFLNDCPADHFLFGLGFLPAEKPMRFDRPTRYWKKFVKDPLGITQDFYKLKHLNTTEVVDQINEQAAAELNAHTSTAMVVSIYDVNQPERKHKKLKDVNNAFA